MGRTKVLARCAAWRRGLGLLALTLLVGCSGVNLKTDPLAGGGFTSGTRGVADGFVFVPSRQVVSGSILPLAKIRVYRLDASGKVLVATGQADAEGHYRIAGLPLNVSLIIEGTDAFPLPGQPARRVSGLVSFSENSTEKQRDLSPATTVVAAMVQAENSWKPCSDSQVEAMEAAAEQALEVAGLPDVTRFDDNDSQAALLSVVQTVTAEVMADLVVVVQSAPATTATVKINGLAAGTVATGAPGLTLTKLPIGSVVVRAEATGFDADETRVTLTAGAPVQVTLTLTKTAAPGTPANAKPVIVAGSVRVTPATLTAAGGRAKLEATVQDTENDPLTVTAVVTGGAGARRRDQQLTLNKLANGLYRAEFDVQANTGTIAQSYDVTVSASDGRHETPTRAFTGFSVAAPIVNRAPVITSLTPSPSTLPAAGGTLSVDADIVDLEGDAITATAEVPNQASVAMTLVSSPTPHWHGSLVLPANTGSVDTRVTVTVKAWDAGHVSSPTSRSAQVTVASAVVNRPPVIASLLAAPTTVPSTGGEVTVDATFTDAEGDALTATLSAPGLEPASMTLLSSPTPHWHGALHVPASQSANSQDLVLTVKVWDAAHVSAPTTRTTSTMQLANQSPTIANLVVTPGGQSVRAAVVAPSAGTSLLVECDIVDTEGDAISASATLTNNTTGRQTGGSVALALVPGTQHYRGVLALGENPFAAARDLTVTVQASDALHTATPAAVSTVVNQGGNQAPVIANAQLRPGVVDAAGGTVTLDCDITDAEGDAIQATCQVVLPAAARRGRTATTPLPLTLVSGNHYRATFDLSANTGTTSLVYEVSLFAADLAHPQPLPQTMQLTQQAGAGNLTPVITGFRLDGSGLTWQGGQVFVYVDAFDIDGDPLTVQVSAATQDGLVKVGPITLTKSTAGTYTGVLQVPGNPSTTPRAWIGTAQAWDPAHEMSPTVATQFGSQPGTNSPPAPPARRR